NALCDPSMRDAGGTLDFLGINYYRSVYAFAAPVPDYVGAAIQNDYSKPALAPPVRHKELNDLGWEVHPDGFYRLLRRVQALTGGTVPVLVTENGYPQDPAKEGRADQRRAQYVLAHLQALLRAHRDGVPLLGYIYW